MPIPEERGPSIDRFWGKRVSMQLHGKESFLVLFRKRSIASLELGCSALFLH